MSTALVEISSDVYGREPGEIVAKFVLAIPEGKDLQEVENDLATHLQKFFDEDQEVYYVDVREDFNIHVTSVATVSSEFGSSLGAILKPVVTRKDQVEHDNDCVDIDVDLGYDV